MEILKASPKHDALSVPCMRLSGLKAEIKRRTGGYRWDKVRKALMRFRHSWFS